MSFRLSLLILSLSLAFQESPHGRPDSPGIEFRGRLSSLRLDSAVLGGGWHGPTGLVVDDLADTSSLKEPEKRLVDQLAKAMGVKGITACADFTYTRRDQPRIVTLRIFAFRSRELAVAWWNEKYNTPEARQLYRAVGGLGDRAVDSLELAKRVVLVGNCLLTCHQLHQGEEYQRLLEGYMKKMKAPANADNAKQHRTTP